MCSKLAHDTYLVPRTEDVLIDKCSFEELSLKSTTLNGLHNCGFQTPSPIQYRAIPIGLCGFDLVLQAKSGTGKTLVFGTICLETIQTQTSELQALILSPTREIAFQTQQLINQIGAGLENLKVEAFIGGLPIEEDRKKVNGCHIAVGAPGRVKHLLVKKVLNPNNIKLLILDEADQLVCESFIEDVKYIHSCLPDKKQVIAASATYSSDFSTFMKIFMKHPSIITAKYEVPTLLGIKQFTSILPGEIGEDFITKELIRLFSQIAFKQCIIFVNKKLNAPILANALKKLNWPSECLTADHDQVTRLAVINKLKSFKCRILVTTDLTARGIDAENVNLVINVEVPLSHATYLHRIGRAGRYGSYGITVTLISDQNQLSNLKDILYKIGGDNMFVEILPQGKIPNLWDTKVKHDFDRLYGGTPTVRTHELNETEQDQELKTKNGRFSNGDPTLNMSKIALENSGAKEALGLGCFFELGEELNEFMKSDAALHEASVSDKSSIEQSINDFEFEKHEISAKLVNTSTCNLSVENLDSIMSEFDKCNLQDFSQSKTFKNHRHFDDFNDINHTDQCDSSPKDPTTNNQFITKLWEATSDLNEAYLNEEDIEENILQKQKHEENKPMPVIKPKPVNQKQLEEDKAFLNMIKIKATKETTKVLDSIQKPPTNVNVVNTKADRIAEEFRVALANVDSETFSYKSDITPSEIMPTRKSETVEIYTTPACKGKRTVLRAVGKCKLSFSNADPEPTGIIHSETDQSSDIIKLKQKAESILDTLENNLPQVDKTNECVETNTALNGNNEAESQCEDVDLQFHKANLQSEAAEKRVLNEANEENSDSSICITDSTVEIEGLMLNTKISEEDGKSTHLDTKITTDSANTSASSSNNLENVIIPTDQVKQKALNQSISSIQKNQNSVLKPLATTSIFRRSSIDKCYEEQTNLRKKQEIKLNHNSERMTNEFGQNIRKKVNAVPVTHNKSSMRSESNDPMHTYNRWNQMWMQQLWQINNYVVQNQDTKDTYTNYYA